MSKRAVIVTLLIGEKYVQQWRRYCEPNWRAYADHHDFDLVAHEAAIDANPNASQSLAWQKLLIGTLEKLQQYPYLIWLDADIVINSANKMPPDILAGMSDGKIGAVRYHPLLAQPLFEMAHRSICRGLTPRQFNEDLFKQYGLEADPSFLLNTGVLVIPRSAGALLADVYAKYKHRPVHPQMQEQVILSYELYANGHTQFIDDKFNACWYEYKYSVYFGDDAGDFNRHAIQWTLAQVYFLHFAGNSNDMSYLTAN